MLSSENVSSLTARMDMGSFYEFQKKLKAINEKFFFEHKDSLEYYEFGSIKKNHNDFIEITEKRISEVRELTTTNCIGGSMPVLEVGIKITMPYFIGFINPSKENTISMFRDGIDISDEKLQEYGFNNESKRILYLCKGVDENNNSYIKFYKDTDFCRLEHIKNVMVIYKKLLKLIEHFNKNIGSGYFMYDLKKITPYISAIIRKYGFIGKNNYNSTVERFQNFLNGNLNIDITEEDNTIYDHISEYVNDLQKEGIVYDSFDDAMVSIYNDGYSSQPAISIYIVLVNKTIEFLKSKRMLESANTINSNSEYVGNIGEHITNIEVKLINHKTFKSKFYNNNTTNIYTLMDRNGNVYSWFTQTIGDKDGKNSNQKALFNLMEAYDNDLDTYFMIGDSIVSKHEEYEGVKKTTIKSVKFVY